MHKFGASSFFYFSSGGTISIGTISASLGFQRALRAENRSASWNNGSRPMWARIHSPPCSLLKGLTQLRYVHRVYCTPKLLLMHKRENPLCNKCDTEQGDFLPMVWACAKIRPFWSKFMEFITSNFKLPKFCSPKCCLLGVLEDVDLPAKTKSFL